MELPSARAKIPFLKPFFWCGLLLLFALLTGCSATNQIAATPTGSPTRSEPFLMASPIPFLATSTPELTYTPTVSPAGTNGTVSPDQASLVDETYPDNSVLEPGESFVKTFEIKNTGSVPWATSYALVLDPVGQNGALGSPARINLSRETPPGSTASISIPLVAPQATGTYTVFWILENDRGASVPVDGGSRVWLKVVVCDAGQTCNPPIPGGGATANGISVSLTSFTHDAQSATVSFCITMPSRYYALGAPAPSLLVDQKPALFLDGGTIPPWGCLEMRYQVSAEELEQAKNITLSIDTALRMSPPPGDPDAACQTSKAGLIANYPGLDFQCHFSMAGYFTNLQLPSGMTREQADRIITDTIEGAIYGPWILKIRGN